MAPTQINSSQPPLVASLMPACSEEPLDAGSQSIPLVPSAPLPMLSKSNGQGKVNEPAPRADSELARDNSSFSIQFERIQQPAGSPIPATANGIPIDVPWVHSEASDTRHQFSPTKVTAPRGLAAIQVPTPPSEDRLKKLASPRVHVSARSPVASSPFYTGLGPGASPNTFTELANQHFFMASTSEPILKPARKAQQATVHTAFGSRVRPMPPAAQLKSKTPSRHNSDSGVARTSHYSVGTAASRAKTARRSSPDAMGSTGRFTASTTAAKAKGHSSFGSSAPTGRAAVSRSFMGGGSAPLHALKTPEAIPHADWARSTHATPASASGLNAENSTTVPQYADGQFMSLAPSEPLTAAAAASTAAGATTSTQATSVPTTAQANLATHSASTEASAPGPPRIESNSGTQAEGSSPSAKPSDSAATNTTPVASAAAADADTSTPNKRQSSNSASQQSPQLSVLPEHKQPPIGGSPVGPRNPPKLKGDDSSAASKNLRSKSRTLQGNSSTTGAYSFAKPAAFELPGPLEQEDSMYSQEPMSMMASVVGSVAEDRVPVSVDSVDIGGVPKRTRSSIEHQSSHKQQQQQQSPDAKRNGAEASRGSPAIASKTLESTAEGDLLSAISEKVSASQRAARAAASAPKKPSFGLRLCGIVLCGAKGAVEDDDSRELTSNRGISTVPSAENTSNIPQPIEPPGGMSPPQSLAPSPVPRLPIPGSSNMPSTGGFEGTAAAGGKGAKLPASSTGAAKGGNKLQPQITRKASNASYSDTSSHDINPKTPSATTRRSTREKTAAASPALAQATTPKVKKTRRGDVKANMGMPDEAGLRQAQLLAASDPTPKEPHSIPSVAANSCLESVLTTTGNRMQQQPMLGTPDAARSLFNTDDGVQGSAHAAMGAAQQSLFSTTDQGQQPIYNTVAGPHGTHEINAQYGAASHPHAPLVDSETEMAASLLPKMTGESQGVIEATMLAHVTLPARVVF